MKVPKFSPRVAGIVLAVAASLSPLCAQAQAAVPLDTSGYSAVFATLNTDMSSVATGPVGLGAFGVLTVGIIFRVCWKLYRKSGNALG